LIFIGIDKIRQHDPTPLEIDVLLVDLFQSSVSEFHQLECGVCWERKLDLYGWVILRFMLFKTICFEKNNNSVAERSLLPQLFRTHGSKSSYSLPHLIKGTEISLESAGGSDTLFLFDRNHLERGNPL